MRSSFAGPLPSAQIRRLVSRSADPQSRKSKGGAICGSGECSPKTETRLAPSRTVIEPPSRGPRAGTRLARADPPGLTSTRASLPHAQQPIPKRTQLMASAGRFWQARCW
jgi:hypothetical protein